MPEVFLDELEKSEDTFIPTLPPETKNPDFSRTLPLGDKFTLQNPKPINAGNELYRNLFIDDVPWDSALSTSDRVVAQESFPDPKDLDVNGKRNVNALFFADQFGMSYADALIMHDQLAESFFDEEDTTLGY